MAAVQKNIIHVKHVFKQYNVLIDKYSLCLLLIRISHLYGCLKCHLSKGVIKKFSQFPQLMGIVINFVIFPLSSLSEVDIRSCRFHAAVKWTNGSRNRVCFIAYILSYLYILYIFACHLFIHCTCVIYSRTLALVATVICWLYPTLNTFYVILSYVKYPAFENWLSARLRYLQFATWIQISVGP